MAKDRFPAPDSPQANHAPAAELAKALPGSKSAQLAAEDERREAVDLEEDEAEAGGGTGRRRDPELLAMERMLRMLEALDEPARGRVVGWIYNRFYPVA